MLNKKSWNNALAVMCGYLLNLLSVVLLGHDGCNPIPVERKIVGFKWGNIDKNKRKDFGDKMYIRI